jgi:hypothetical protein
VNAGEPRRRRKQKDNKEQDEQLTTIHGSLCAESVYESTASQFDSETGDARL